MGEWERDRVRVMVDGDPVVVRLGDVAAMGVGAESEGEVEPAGDGGDNAVVSPLPGVVLSIDVKVGDRVSAGDKVCVLEAMKMEQEITASSDGQVKAVKVQKGQSVLIGQTIIELG